MSVSLLQKLSSNGLHLYRDALPIQFTTRVSEGFVACASLFKKSPPSKVAKVELKHTNVPAQPLPLDD